MTTVNINDAVLEITTAVHKAMNEITKQAAKQTGKKIHLELYGLEEHIRAVLVRRFTPQQGDSIN